jgi:hypothetical protein
MVASFFELPPDSFIAIEFAVDDDPRPLVFARDGLVTGRKVDNTESSVPKRNPAVWRDPMSLTVWTAMVQALSSPLHNGFRHGTTTREDSDYTAHTEVLPVSKLKFFGNPFDDLRSTFPVSVKVSGSNQRVSPPILRYFGVPTVFKMRPSDFSKVTADQRAHAGFVLLH